MDKGIIIFNPKSGTGESNEIADLANKHLNEKYKGGFTLEPTKKTKSARDILNEKQISSVNSVT